MITLGIETSCDETALCLLETRGSDSGQSTLEYRVLAHIVHSQIDIHEKYGGVYPMLAKREHAKRLAPILEKIIIESGIDTENFEPSKKDLKNIIQICGEHDEYLAQSILDSALIKVKPSVDRIAVTFGPGLEPALWVGINFANAISTLWKIPVIRVNHMEGHIVASLLPDTQQKYSFEKLIACHFPAIAFLASGGHTEIVLVKEIGDYKILGSTRDDAIGEAFDKVARMLGIPYPGGPQISKLADIKRKEKASVDTQFSIVLPRPMINVGALDMSFAGLKTAVLYELRKHKDITDDLKKEIAIEFENAITDVIIAKLEKSFNENKTKTLIVGGGVFANKHILKACKKFSAQRGVVFLPPARGLSGDNALMIAMVGALKKEWAKVREITAQGNLSIDSKI